MATKQQILDLAAEGKHFCVLPWVHFHAWPDSRVMPCCVADSTHPVSQVEPGQSILDMMNSEDFQEIRKLMLEDHRVEVCRRCYELEDMGVTTMRQSHNLRRGAEYADYISTVTESDGRLTEFKLKYMDIRFSNLCNMKCRSCGPGCSSLWAMEFRDKRGAETFEACFPDQDVLVDNNPDGAFMAELEPYLADVAEVYFAGGEIIITPEHYECLDYWIDNNLTEQVELNYTTNLSTLRYKKGVDLIEYWKQFPHIQVWGSLDAHGSLAECIRSGTVWSKIEENIRELRHNVPHAQFQITPTISIWNIFGFGKFIDYMYEKELVDADTVPRFNFVTDPWYANISILPDHTREYLMEYYEVYKERYEGNPGIQQGFDLIINNLRAGEQNAGGILQFREFNDDLDRFRSETLTDVVPELADVYKWATDTQIPLLHT